MVVTVVESLREAKDDEAKDTEVKGDEVMAKAKAAELSPKEQVKAKRADLIDRLTAMLGEIDRDLTMVRVHRLLAEAREHLRTA